MFSPWGPNPIYRTVSVYEHHRLRQITAFTGPGAMMKQTSLLRQAGAAAFPTWTC